MMPPRRTKIIATLGPASRSEPTVRALLDNGVDTFRLNFSYGTSDEHTSAIELIRRLSGETGKPVAIVQDLQGPKIRVARLSSAPFQLERGKLVTFTTEGVTGNATRIPIDYPELPRAVKSGDRILMGDGEMELIVESATASTVRARVLEGGMLKDSQGISVPGVAIAPDALTEKDLADLRLGLLMDVDYVALSLVRSGDDVRRLKGLIREQGGRAQVIAKLEKREAIDNLGDILAVADGVMVARGDLGLELPLETVPLLQKEIIRRANARGVLVITATQMLQTMVDKPRPTRAEASDVANAILDGTDAVMLSAETAVGHYAAESVAMMSRIALEAERWPAQGHSERPRLTRAHAMSRAACELARDVRASAIVVFTRSGYSAHLVSKERPSVPIFAFTPSQAVARQLTLWWGVTPLLVDFQPLLEEMIASADRCLADQGHLRPGEVTVLARWSSRRTRGWTNFVKLHRLGARE